MSKSASWVDVLDKELAHVVLRKGNRLQVILRPTPKQLRRRGKRGWSLVTTTVEEESNGQATVSPDLRDAILEALTELICGDKAESEKPREKKRRKVKA